MMTSVMCGVDDGNGLGDVDDDVGDGDVVMAMTMSGLLYGIVVPGGNDVMDSVEEGVVVLDVAAWDENELCR